MMRMRLCAIKKGLSLALQWSHCSVSVEEAVNLVKRDLDISHHSFIVCEIKLLVEHRYSCITRIRRTQNRISHSIAAYGMNSWRTTVCLGSGLGEVVKLCKVTSLTYALDQSRTFAHDTSRALFFSLFIIHLLCIGAIQHHVFIQTHKDPNTEYSDSAATSTTWKLA